MAEAGEGGAGALEDGALLRRRLLVLADGVADFAAGVAAVAAEGELAGAEVVHAEVEEGVVLFLAVVLLDLGVDAEVHVSVDGGVVMADGNSLRGWEQVCKVAGGGWDGICGEWLVVVLGDVVFGDMVQGGVVVVVEVLLLRRRGVRVDGCAGVFFKIVAALVAFYAAEARPRPRHLGAGAVLCGSRVGGALARGS